MSQTLHGTARTDCRETARGGVLGVERQSYGGIRSQERVRHLGPIAVHLTSLGILTKASRSEKEPPDGTSGLAEPQTCAKPHVRLVPTTT